MAQLAPEYRLALIMAMLAAAAVVAYAITHWRLGPMPKGESFGDEWMISGSEIARKRLRFRLVWGATAGIVLLCFTLVGGILGL